MCHRAIPFVKLPVASESHKFSLHFPMYIEVWVVVVFVSAAFPHYYQQHFLCVLSMVRLVYIFQFQHGSIDAQAHVVDCFDAAVAAVFLVVAAADVLVVEAAAVAMMIPMAGDLFAL